jgi:hypothetical protein
MTRDEIFKLARECADNCDGYGFAFYTRSLERFAALVAASEREACAKLAQNRYLADASEKDRTAHYTACKNIAADIRARGNN